MRIERVIKRGLRHLGFCGEFLMWTLTRRIEDDASTSPCQGEAIRSISHGK